MGCATSGTRSRWGQVPSDARAHGGQQSQEGDPCVHTRAVVEVHVLRGIAAQRLSQWTTYSGTRTACRAGRRWWTRRRRRAGYTCALVERHVGPAPFEMIEDQPVRRRSIRRVAVRAMPGAVWRFEDPQRPGNHPKSLSEEQPTPRTRSAFQTRHASNLKRFRGGRAEAKASASGSGGRRFSSGGGGESTQSTSSPATSVVPSAATSRRPSQARA